jgi:7-cyano-7-deazaguanine synthase
MHEPYTSIILLSGGIDSTVLLHSLVKEQNESPLALIFKYGQRHKDEVNCAQLQASMLKIQYNVLDVTNIFLHSKSALCGLQENMPDTIETLGDAQPITYVPWRNGVFLTIALSLAENFNVSKVYYGAQLNDNYQFFDTTPDFVQLMNSLTDLNRKHTCQIIAPFASTPKTDIVSLGLKLEVDFTKVISCYNPAYGLLHIKACGRCPSCTQRVKAFKTLGKKDPFRYTKLRLNA